MSANRRRAISTTPWISSWISGLLLVIPMAVLSGAMGSAPASAQAASGSSQHLKAKKTPGRYRETGQYRGSKAEESLRAHRRGNANRHLVSPLGSATNVNPNLYLELGYQAGHPTVYTAPPEYRQQHRQQHRQHRGDRRGHGYRRPYVVYINEDSIEPPIYGEPDYGESDYGESHGDLDFDDGYAGPQPIYIVNQQPAPQVIHVPAPAPQPLPTVERSYEPPPQTREPSRPRSTEPQEVSIRVEPADAEIYLDDELLGTGATVMSSLSSLAPGIYVLEISQPDFSPQRLVFGVSTDPVAIFIDLTADRPSRRARVK